MGFNVKKLSPTALLNKSQINFPPKLISFVSKKKRSLMTHTSLFNRTNNIIDSNADVA
jgi:hypothetical protein